MNRPTAIHVIAEGERRPESACPHLQLAMEPIGDQDDASIFALKLTNQGPSPVPIGAVELTYRETPFLRGPATAFRFYKEGLTAVGVSGSLAATACDVELDPGFLPLTVSDPEHYSWEQPGQLTAEHMGLLSRHDTGEACLLGFVTAHRFCCRILLDARDEACVVLRAIIDTDDLLLAPGETWDLETLMAATGSNHEALLSAYAGELGAQMQARVPAAPVSGWCSYYYYYGQETEEAILENARFIATHRDRCPVDIVQIDDGWQRARGDWMTSHPEKFPHGMAWLAGEITKLGLRPGLWVAPLLVTPGTRVYQDHPEWLLHDRAGDLMTMGDNCFLDPTHPEASAWIGDLFRTFRGWGYDYFKLDFLFVATCHSACYHDQTKGRLEAYRQVLQVIRETVGPDAYVLGGTGLIAANVGLVDSCRVGTDVTPFWSRSDCTPESPAIVNVCRNIINRSYVHGQLWDNDPDCLIVREAHGRAKYAHIPSLTLQETHLLASAILLSGGSLFLGDRLDDLPPERLAIIRQVMALANGRSAIPIDRMECLVPRLWFRRGEGTKQKPHLMGLFNWEDKPAELSVPLERLGLDGTQHWQIHPIWSGQPFVTMTTTALSTGLPGHACALIKLCQLPQGDDHER